MSEERQGHGIDAQRGPVIDPTANVIALNEAAQRRQDDLREAMDKLVVARLECTKEIISLRAEFQRTIDTIRDNNAKQLSEAEAKRIDAIRAVDVQAVQIASSRASEQATALAAQVAATAEAARNQVATMAAQVTTNFQQVTNELSQRLRVLEQLSSQTVGKQSLADPAMVELLSEVKTLRSSSQAWTGKSEGISASWGVFAGAAVIALAMIFGVLQLALHNGGPVVAPTPAVVQPK